MNIVFSALRTARHSAPYPYFVTRPLDESAFSCTLQG